MKIERVGWYGVLALTFLVVLVLIGLSSHPPGWLKKWRDNGVTTIVKTPNPQVDTGAVVAEAASVPASATPPADASSAPPAEAASAPAPAQAPALKRTYTVKDGDTLSGVFGVKGGKAVCTLMQLKDCDKIEPGWVLDLPDGIEPQGKTRLAVKKSKAQAKAIAPKAAATPKTRTKSAPKAIPASVPKTNAQGEILYATVGRAPLRECGKKDVATVNEEAWTALGLSEADKVYLRKHADKAGPRINITAKEGLVQILPDTRIEQVTFCRQGKAVAVGPMRTAWSADTAVYGERFVLPSGQVLVWMRNCFNWITWPAPPPLEVPAPAPIPAAPVPSPAPLAPLPAPKPVVEERCVIDPKLVFGQEHEPKVNGNDAHSNFLSAGVYCKWRGEGGTHGVGAGLQASSWNGHVNNGAGHFKGNLVAFGPGYTWEDDNGWDLETKALFGRIKESFEQGDYKSDRKITGIGPSVGVNLNQRRQRGEKLFPELQLFGAALFPLDKEGRHTWQGQPIADETELLKFKAYFNAGARLWIYDGDYVSPYIQVGYFLEDPTSESASFRIGIADANRICGIGVGLDYDLKHGGDAKAWGWWCDGMKAINVARAEYRQSQIETELAEDGYVIDDGLRVESLRPESPADH